MINLFTALILSYLVGAIPTSVWVGKLAKGVDLRRYGSGNAGFTNAYRVLGLKYALLVLVVDVFKGTASVLWLWRLPHYSGLVSPQILPILAGLCAILGHIFPLFADFRGGKGVNTTLGVFLGLAPLPTFFALLVFLGFLLSTRYVSLSSLSATFSLPLILAVKSFIFGLKINPYLFIFSLIVAFIVLVTHRSNIRRLLAGEERKIGEKVKA